MSTKLSGYAPALPTPFDKDDKVDAEAFERLCELQIQEGATALVVLRDNRRSADFDPRGALRIDTHGRSGIARPCAGHRRRRLERNGSCDRIEPRRGSHGADAILSVVPYYNKPTQEGLYAHFREIAVLTGLPIILYDDPARTVAALPTIQSRGWQRCRKLLVLRTHGRHRPACAFAGALWTGLQASLGRRFVGTGVYRTGG